MKINRSVLKHLGIAKQIIMGKIEVWIGREPFPGSPLKTYKSMLADLVYEMHDIEPTDERVALSPRLRTILLQYRTLLVDADLLWDQQLQHKSKKWIAALVSLDSILDKTPVNKDPILIPITVRPNSSCIERGICKIKVTVDNMKSDVPQLVNGTWVFQVDTTYSQARECLICGRRWETTYKDGKENTAVTEEADRVML
jgi:hypothetical protein